MKRLNAFQAPFSCAIVLLVGLGVAVDKQWLNSNEWAPWGVAWAFLLLATGNRWLFQVPYAPPTGWRLLGHSLLITNGGMLRLVGLTLTVWLILWLGHRAPLPLTVACASAIGYFISLMRVQREA